MIAESKLLDEGAELKSYKKGEIIFSEHSRASYYFQISKGRVKMISITIGGKEVIQNIFESGESFGEPPLMGDFPYPSRAVALTNCRIWRINKKNFLRLLQKDTDLHFRLTQLICRRMEFKAQLLKRVSINGAKERILSFIDFLKRRTEPRPSEKQFFILPYTRQQLADSLALRVETVIRAVKELEAEGEVKIVNRKICRLWEFRRRPMAG